MSLEAVEPRPAPPWELAIVVRHDDYIAAKPEQRIALVRAFTDVDEAARLTAVAARQGQSTTFFVRILHQRDRS